jgi:DNA-binding CsgD family transcriptional regulator/PAS domain-containing protein
MTTDTNLLSLINAFHEAALEPELWQSALARLGEAVGGSGVVVLSAYDPLGGAQLIKSVGYNPEYWDRVQAEHSSPETNRYIGLLNSAVPGQVLQPRALMSLDDWLEDPIHRKFLRPDGLGDGLTCPLVHKAGGFAAIAMFRRRHYDPEHLQFLEAAAPHIRHALDVHLRLNEQARDVDLSRLALDHLRVGVMLSDRQGRVMIFNRAAENILNRSGGISLGRGGFLQAWKPGETNRLQVLMVLIANAADCAVRSDRKMGRPEVSMSAGGAIMLARSSGLSPIEALVAPLRPPAALKADAGRDRPLVIIFLSDPEEVVELDVLALRQMYGLTAAESRLIVQLLVGMDIPRAARMVGISVNTARTLLKRSFERTNTTRQSDLVSKILRGPLSHVVQPRPR